MATATATAGGSSNNNAGAVSDAKGRGVEAIGVGGNNKDCSTGTRSLLTVVVQL